MRNVMFYLIRHAYYGNDASPRVVAGTRAMVTAVGLGLTAWLGAWMTDASNQTQVGAGLIPFIGTVMARFGIEGAVDAHKERKGQG